MNIKKFSRISVQVHPKVLKDLESFVAKTNKPIKKIKVTKSDVVREAIISYVKGGSSPLDEDRTHDSLLRKSRSLKKDGVEAKYSGSKRRSRKLFLAAASKELEALSILDEPSESILRSTIIEVLLLLKEATGYRRLPEVPSTKESTVING
jgi:hypothetical protein